MASQRTSRGGWIRMSGSALAMFLAILPVTAQDGSSINGTIRSRVDPLSNALVELRSESSPERSFRATTDAVGIYHFSNVSAGHYTIKIEAQVFRPLTVR